MIGKRPHMLNPSAQNGASLAKCWFLKETDNTRTLAGLRMRLRKG
jgi:hypothetical protein